MEDNPKYVTPEEADAIACPMSMGSTEFASTCFGTKCMAWRWAMNFEKVDTPEGKEWSDLYSTTHGYCGMVHNG